MFFVVFCAIFVSVDCFYDRLNDTHHHPQDTCLLNQFRCHGGRIRCIPVEWQCNRSPDCEDGSDERFCRRSREDTTATSRRTSSETLVERRGPSGGPRSGPSQGPREGPSLGPSLGPRIDPNEGHRNGPRNGPSQGPNSGPNSGHSSGPNSGPNSGTNSGPKNGPSGLCPPNFFACLNHCINDTYVCDGDADCEDGRDEAGCSEIRCDASRFRCPRNGTFVCIDIEWRCDGEVDCDDVSDEISCGDQNGLWTDLKTTKTTRRPLVTSGATTSQKATQMSNFSGPNGPVGSAGSAGSPSSTVSNSTVIVSESTSFLPETILDIPLIIWVVAAATGVFVLFICCHMTYVIVRLRKRKSLDLQSVKYEVEKNVSNK